MKVTRQSWQTLLLCNAVTASATSITSEANKAGGHPRISASPLRPSSRARRVKMLDGGRQLQVVREDKLRAQCGRGITASDLGPPLGASSHMPGLSVATSTAQTRPYGLSQFQWKAELGL